MLTLTVLQEAIDDDGRDPDSARLPAPVDHRGDDALPQLPAPVDAVGGDVALARAPRLVRPDQRRHRGHHDRRDDGRPLRHEHPNRYVASMGLQHRPVFTMSSLEKARESLKLSNFAPCSLKCGKFEKAR